MPDMNTRPKKPDINHTDITDAEIENKATCVMVSNDTAKSAPTKIMEQGFDALLDKRFKKILLGPEEIMLVEGLDHSM